MRGGYVCCYDCVINDDTSISAHASIVMQRFKLTNHYTKYHPDCVKQEYKFTEEKPAKQSKLSIFINKDKEESLSSGACSTVNSMEQSESNFDVIEPEINSTSTISQIYTAVKSIRDMVSKCFELIKKIAVKCGIEENDISKYYGVYASI